MSNGDKVFTVSIDLAAARRTVSISDEDAERLVRFGLHGGGSSSYAAEVLKSIESPLAIVRLLKAASEAKSLPEELREAFRLQWTVQSHRIRDVFADDQLLADVLRQAMPPYMGPGLVIYRGEQAVRFASGQIGFNWSANRRVAEMFASGLCATYAGGGGCCYKPTLLQPPSFRVPAHIVSISAKTR